MKLQEQFSEENLKKKLIEKIEHNFGKDHNIKLAMFKANSEYNDEGYDYNPNLILIDSNFQEIDHNIEVWDMIPKWQEFEEMYEEDSEELMIENITIKF